jgi:hypothetical protein
MSDQPICTNRSHYLPDGGGHFPQDASYSSPCTFGRLTPLERGIAQARSLGHDMEDRDEIRPGSRSTCRRCGRSVLFAGGPLYGSALDGPCPAPEPGPHWRILYRHPTDPGLPIWQSGESWSLSGLARALPHVRDDAYTALEEILRAALTGVRREDHTTRPCGCGLPLYSEDAEDEEPDRTDWCSHWCIEDVMPADLRKGDFVACRGDIPLEVTWLIVESDPDPDTHAILSRPVHGTREATLSTPFPDRGPHQVLRVGMVGRQTLDP